MTDDYLQLLLLTEKGLLAELKARIAAESFHVEHAKRERELVELKKQQLSAATSYKEAYRAHLQKGNG